MKITIGNTQHTLENWNWQNTLVAVIRMLRVEGYVFTDKDVISNLDELLTNGMASYITNGEAQSEAFNEGFNQAINQVNESLLQYGLQADESGGISSISSDNKGKGTITAQIDDRGEEEVRPSSSDRARDAMGKLIATSEALKLYGDYGVGKQGDVTSTEESGEEADDFRMR